MYALYQDDSNGTRGVLYCMLTRSVDDGTKTFRRLDTRCHRCGEPHLLMVMCKVQSAWVRG